MRKVIVLPLFLVILFAPKVEATDQTECEKALISLMFEDIKDAINEHYEFNGVQSENEKILDLNMIGGISFDVTIQISTFIGAHNTIGTDKLRFKREVSGVKLVSYEHNPSELKEEILEWYFNTSANP